MYPDFQSTRSSRQSASQQFKLIPPQSLRVQKTAVQINFQNYSVPCMNCETLVPVNEIDRHTSICTQVSKSVTAVLKSNSLSDEINFKIEKLRESLRQLCTSEKRQDNLKYLIRADEIAEQIFNIQHSSQIEQRKLQDLNQELKTLTEAYRGSLCIALYLERLHSLGIQKQTQFEKLHRIEIPRPSTRDNNRYQSPGVGRPTMITKFSGGSNDRQQMFDMKSEILTKISTSQFDSSEESNQDFDTSQNQYGQQQRMFYSKCLNHKTQLPNNHPSQKIPLCILHKEMLTRRIPQSQWDSFIKEALNNPHMYLDMGKVQHSQGIRNNLINMASEAQLRQRLHNL